MPNGVRYSVITVCFNDLQGLITTRRSLKAQTLLDYEWLVIDGASRDGTVQWLSSLGYPGCQWLSEPDSGLYDAMNKGLDRASGDYVIFMNSGDSFADGRTLEKVAGCIAELHPRPDFVYGDSLDVTADGRQFYRVTRGHRSVWRGMFTQHQAMFFSRARVGRLRYRLDYPLSADYAFIAEFLQTGPYGERAKTLRLDFPVCCFALGGQSWNRRLEALREDFQIRRRVLSQPVWLSGGLFAAHLIHTYIKKAFPGLTRGIRYEGTFQDWRKWHT